MNDMCNDGIVEELLQDAERKLLDAVANAVATNFKQIRHDAARAAEVRKLADKIGREEAIKQLAAAAFMKAYLHEWPDKVTGAIIARSRENPSTAHTVRESMLRLSVLLQPVKVH